MDVRIGGAWKSPTTAEAYIGGAWRTLVYGEAYIGGAWKRVVSFVQPLTLTTNRSPAFGAISSASPMTTVTATAVPTGGLGPFTYSWTTLSQSGLSGFVITTPSSAGTTFSASVTAGSGHTGTASVRCTATDALGTSATTDLTVSFTESSGGSGTL